MTEKAIQTTWIIPLCCIASLSGCSSQGDSVQQTLDQAEQPVAGAVQAIEHDYQRADAQHQDPVDRAFAPLDDTVDDLNHDLNKGDGGDDAG